MDGSCCCKDDVAVSPCHLNCRMQVREFCHCTLRIAPWVHHLYVGRRLLVVKRIVDYVGNFWIILGSGTLLSLIQSSHLAAILDPVIGVGLGPACTFWLSVWVHGWTFSYLLARVGIGSGLVSCYGSGCCVICSFSSGLDFGCCCSRRASASPSCIVSACCEAFRSSQCCLAVSSLSSVLTSSTDSALPIHGLASTTTAMCLMSVPHITFSLWQSSHIVSQFSSNSFMLSHCIIPRATCACTNLTILLIVWYRSVTSGTYCIIDCLIWLVLSSGAFVDCGISLLSHFPVLFRLISCLAARKDTIVMFPDIVPAMGLASSASPMLISLLLGGSLMIPPIWLKSSWIALVAGSLDVESDRSCLLLACFNYPGVPEVSFWGQLDGINQDRMSLCCSMPILLRYFEVSHFLFYTRTYRTSSLMSGLLCAFLFGDTPPLLRQSRCDRSLILESIRC